MSTSRRVCCQISATILGRCFRSVFIIPSMQAFSWPSTSILTSVGATSG